jgi:hypothetical protein
MHPKTIERGFQLHLNTEDAQLRDVPRLLPWWDEASPQRLTYPQQWPKRVQNNRAPTLSPLKESHEFSRLGLSRDDPRGRHTVSAVTRMVFMQAVNKEPTSHRQHSDGSNDAHH